MIQGIPMKCSVLFLLLWFGTGLKPTFANPHGDVVPTDGENRPEQADGSAPGIRLFPATVRLTFGVPALDITLDVDGTDEEHRIRSNTSPNLGIEGFYAGFGLGVSYRTEPAAESIDARGKTAYRDYQFYYYGKRIGGSAFYQDYTGFYVEPEGGRDQCDSAPGCQLLPQLSMTNYGLTGYFVFSPRFSLRAAFKQTARQIGSAGSWLLMVNTNRLTLDNPTPLPPPRWAPQLGDVVGLNKAEFYNAGLSGGYGYTFAGERWFASPVLFAGGSYQHRQYTDFGGRHSDSSVAANVVIKLAAGYHGDRHILGLVALMNSVTAGIGDLGLQWFSGTVEFFYGIHF